MHKKLFTFALIGLGAASKVPVVEDADIPNLRNAEGALGLAKRQGPLGGVGLPGLQALQSVANGLPLPVKKRQLPDHVPLVNNDELPDLKNTEGALGIDTARVVPSKIPLVDNKDLPDLGNAEKAVGLDKRQFRGAKLPLLNTDELPDLDPTLKAFGLEGSSRRSRRRRQLSSADFPLVNEQDLPNLDNTENALGLGKQNKRQLPKIPLIDESALPDLSGTEAAFGIKDDRRVKKRGLALPSIGDNSALDGVKRLAGALEGAASDATSQGTGGATGSAGIAGLKKTKRDGLGLPLLDKAQLPDLKKAESALGILDNTGDTQKSGSNKRARKTKKRADGGLGLPLLDNLALPNLNKTESRLGIHLPFRA
ncbi:uncharacterized protein PV09_03692 [Verruconis gallopava]|uniref:Uncharacterized protein n=1 Tax=Verruconis gallopava TaxID=253628 RepID=A0A0D1XR13_9PEZI|nr:uncharacterized protein PV09_03692 [Verruconis gallopava]KIW05141.1 hypothetical protein PV09_03692 [Verruconis gallopava]